MKNNNPLISVIVPTWNSSSFLAQAIESILNQTHKNLEIIIVDDGSTDDTEEILQQYLNKIIYLKQNHAGAWQARNYALQKASGDYIAFQDSDDISEDKRLELQLDLILNKPETEIVFGMMEEFEIVDNNFVSRKGRERLPGCCPGTMLAKKEVFAKVGLFSTKWQLAGFMDWYQKAKKLGIRNQMLDTIILKRRIHSLNSGAGKHELLQKEFTEVLLGSK